MSEAIELGLEPKVVGNITYNGRDYPITNEAINDILTTAIESGIGYWCESMGSDGPDLGVGPGLHLGEGGQLKFTCVEGDGDVLMNLDTFLEAYSTHCEEKGWDPEEMHEQGDCEDADVIVQYALFGELVYG